MEISSDHHRVVDRLGRGRSSVVFKAFDVESGEAAALKVFTGASADVATVAAELRREVRAASVLATADPPAADPAAGDDFVVAYARRTLLVTTAAGPRPALALPFVEGAPLAEWLAAGPAPEERRHVVTRLLRAVCWLHAAGVAHGDLSLGNVLVTPSGRVALVDFGRSATLDDPADGEASEASLPATGLFNDPRQRASVAGDLRAVAILSALALGETHPFAADARALFEGSQSADFTRSPGPIRPSRLLGEAEARRVDFWLRPALEARGGVTAAGMLARAPF